MNSNNYYSSEFSIAFISAKKRVKWMNPLVTKRKGKPKGKLKDVMR